MLHIRIVRNKVSYQYKIDKSKNDYTNNINNNSKDVIIILDDDTPIFKAFCQTVANHPDFSFKDTIRPGTFQIKCFVEHRQMHGEIHGIVDAFDLDGQKINQYSMQFDNGYQKGRWLIHDKWAEAKNRDLHNAYSGGCFIMSSIDLVRFNDALKNLGVKPGTVINGNLMEV